MRHSGSLTLQVRTEGEDGAVEHFYLVKAPPSLPKPSPVSPPLSVKQAIGEVIKAYTRLENSRSTRDERAARTALERAARRLRLAEASDQSFPKQRTKP